MTMNIRTALCIGLAVSPLLAFADTSFIPLTQLPGIVGLSTTPSLPVFLNSLYKICIGIVAFLAVLQMIYAGWQIMTSSGSVTKNSEAKKRIGNALFGLVLVLSPAIVFGIINPQILSLNFDVSGLQSSLNHANTPGPSSVSWTDANASNLAADTQRCAAEGGSVQRVCQKSGQPDRPIATGETCASGETAVIDCLKTPTAAAGGSCATFQSITAIKTSDIVSYQDGGYAKVADSCCSNLAAGFECWAKPK